jgi:uncharacterized protein
MTATLLVVAKAPVPGLAKTRLAATVGDDAAADVAAAALLDTLDAMRDTPAAARVVALTGDLDRAARADEIRSALADFHVVAQRGNDFAQRLAHAHVDAAAAAGGGAVLQIGMDTPQVSADLLERSVTALAGGQAVLGLASDGGWWALGVTDAALADCLREVPMSQSDTGELTLKALRHRGVEVALLDELTDVDTIGDVAGVRRCCPPGSRFAMATAGW